MTKRRIRKEKFVAMLPAPARYASICAGALAATVCAGVFYQSLVIGLLFSPLGWLTPRLVQSKLERWRIDRTKRQFMDALQSIASSLSAGRSVDNAVASVSEDLRTIYPNPRTEIRVEFERIRSLMRNGDALEHGLAAWAKRTGIEDIRVFADVVSTAKRSGGDLVAAVRGAAEQLRDKMEVERELQVILARKRFESRTMLAAPFLFVSFLSFAAPDYMAPLYSGIGYALLTAALLALAGCFWLADRWMNIQV